MPDTELEQLIAAYIDARTFWLASAGPGDELLSSGDKFDAFEHVTDSLIQHRCTTLCAVRRKVSFVLNSPDLFIAIREDEHATSTRFRSFLNSLVGPHAWPK